MNRWRNIRACLNAFPLLSSLLLLSPDLSPVSGSASADQPALDFSSLGSGSDFIQGSYSLGWRFTAVSPVDVTALGFYDDLQNGLTESHDVGIFQVGTCQLLASATISPSDPLTGFFRYHAITPVRLAANADYYIAAVNGSERYAINVTTLNVDPAITFGGFVIFGNTQSTTQLQCPNGSSIPSFNGDFGPSFKIAGGPPVQGGKRDTISSVACNRGANPADDYVCTATVGALDGLGPNPTGTVVWSLPTGRGSFRYGGTCTLGTSAAPNVTSFCSVVYVQPPERIPLGRPVPVGAAFSGDAAYNGSSGQGGPGTGVDGPGTTAKICLTQGPGACDGVNVEALQAVSAKAGLGNVLLSYFGAFGVTGGSSSRLARLTPPRRKGDVAVRVRYAMFRSDNPLISQVLPLPRAVGGRTIALGEVRSTLRFGQSRDLHIPMTRLGRQFLQVLDPTKIGNLNIRVNIEAVRQGDRKPTSLLQIINVRVR